MGILRPEPTEGASGSWFFKTRSSTVFLEGVKRLDRLRFFREVVGVEEGVVPPPMLVFSLFSTLKSAVLLAGIANFTASELELPVELKVPVLLEPGGGTVGGATMTPRPLPAGGIGVTNSSC